MAKAKQRGRERVLWFINKNLMTQSLFHLVSFYKQLQSTVHITVRYSTVHGYLQEYQKGNPAWVLRGCEKGNSLQRSSSNLWLLAFY
jgi:hypothetical protein